MPGVGVAPGLTFLFTNFGSGIPGVGVTPFGTEFTTFDGTPVVLFADCGCDVVGRPGEGDGALAEAFADLDEFVFVDD